VAALAREHGDDPAAVDEVMEFFLRARSDVVSHLYPDVRAAISELRGAGLMVGALTNGNADIRMHEETADLFDFYVRRRPLSLHAEAIHSARA
jgi:FMN phosphatase YigB (HAD superfamily)